ncbi:UNVERIFIED_CONTAM: hypothetical protein HDU68_002826 [Siphonaria sp. JEL0065]|nr:hypothetical protein HDU68_002826 [Siphonaria sp. JEL0065]
MKLIWLALAAIYAVQAKKLGLKITGHYDAGMTKQASKCDYTFEVNIASTCQEVADFNAMTITVFAAMNSWLQCGNPKTTLKKGTIVCVSSVVAEDSNGTTQQGQILGGVNAPSLGKANRPNFNGTMPGRNTTTAGVSGTATTTIPAATDGSSPSPSPNAPPPPPPPSPCNMYDGSCAVRAQSDGPPNYREYDEVTECLTLANYARQLYNPGVWDLHWDSTLAAYAQDSAAYSSINDCNECHTNSGPGTSWGQNLYLGQCTCSDAYFGWVTNEAMGQDPSNPDAGHFLNVVGLDIPYTRLGCGASSAGGGCSIVCNYGL